jgi:predicted metal-dependent enzyme (double-stranded beta helix superfamily)
MLNTLTLTRHRSSLDTDALAAIASALLAAPQLWRGAARFDPDVRRPVRLFADETFEAWVIGWFTGQGLGLHDHGESAGAIVVADGRLHEVTLGPRGPQRRTLDRGLVRRIPAKTVHSVTNLDARAATSLHVYSPPLERMTHFEGSDRRPTATTVDVAPETAVLPSAVAQLVRLESRI